MNERTHQYELPASERPAKSPESDTLTNYSCPVCRSPLKKFGYSDKKTGEPKTMLRCSNVNNRREGCKEVAFWWTSQQHWWSKVYGELGEETAEKPQKQGAKTQAVKKRQ